jgi:hypothetical protein
VLHHLPDPERGFQRIVPLAAQTARVLVWLYALEGNEFRPLADRSDGGSSPRAPSWINRVAGAPRGPALAPHQRRLRPARPTVAPPPLRRVLPLLRRLGRTFWGTVYDKLVPPVAFYLTRGTIRRWLAAARSRDGPAPPEREQLDLPAQRQA